MESEWKSSSLKELCVVLIDCDHKTPGAVECGVPYIGIPQMDHGRINFDASPRLISEEDYIRWTKKADPKYGDIILSRRCNSGETVYVPRGTKFALGQNLVLLRPTDDRLHPEFLRWAVQGREWWSEVAKYLNPGAIFESLKCADIPKFRIKVPPKNQQIKISVFLASISNKIELNRQMNATLEAMAQTLFKSWFVNFDPVIDNALTAGNPIPEALQARAAVRQALGDKRKPLPETIRKQFPSSFELSEEMGWVPEGWKPKPLDYIAHYQNGLALQKFRPEDENDFLPVLKIAHLRKGRTDGEEKASPDIKPECIIDDGDVVFSWSGSLMVDIWCGGKAALNQHLFKVTSELVPKWFYYQYTIHHLHEFQRIAADKAVTMGHIKREHLRQALCAVPPETLIYQCSEVMDGWLNKAIMCRVENKQMTKLRDTLLPKLLSGELRIPDAEKLVANAL